MKKAKTRIAAERVVKNVADKTDKLLVQAGESAKKRLRARNGSAMRTAGKVALVLGAGAATAYAGRTVLARVNGGTRGRGRKRK